MRGMAPIAVALGVLFGSTLVWAQDEAPAEAPQLDAQNDEEFEWDAEEKPETGEPETGEPEAGEPEAGEPETGEPETGESETGEPEAGEAETGEPEAGEPATSTAEPEVTDTEAPSTEAEVEEAGTTITEVEEEGEPSPPRYEYGISVAPKLGLSIPTSKLGATSYWGLEVGYRLPWLLDGLLGVAFELGWLRPEDTGSGTSDVAGDFDYVVRNRAWLLMLEANAEYPVGPVVPYGGVGYGFYLMQAHTRTYGFSHRQSQTRAGLLLHGGVGLPIWHGDAFAEVRYHYTNLRFRITGKSNAGAFTGAVGYRFRF